MEKRIKRRIGVLAVLGMFMAIALSTSVVAVEDHNDDLDMDDLEWIGLASTDGRIIFDDEATDEIEITSANVGIGTASPDNLLDIEKSGTAKSNIDIFHITNSVNVVDMDGTETSILFNQWYYDASTPAVADAGRITVGTETEWRVTASTQDGYMAFHTVKGGSVSEQVRITSDGNVGILTNSPQANLQVGDPIIAAPGSTDRIAIASHSTATLWRITARDDASNAHLDLSYGGTAILTTRNDGNVGIGVISPNEQLEVNGKIRTNNVYNVGGTDGWTTVVVIPDGVGSTHTLTFTGGILTGYAVV